MMFSPSSAHIAPFCPNNGADAARQYASVDGISYATFPFRKPCARPPYYSQDVRISPPAQNVADLIPSIGVSTQVNLRSGIIWKVIAAVSRNSSNAEPLGSVPWAKLKIEVNSILKLSRVSAITAMCASSFPRPPPSSVLECGVSYCERHPRRRWQTQH